MITLNSPFARIKHWYVHICLCQRLQTTLTFIQNVSYQRHGGRGWWWWSFRIGKKAGKPLTTVRDCVSTFESVKPVDIFDNRPSQRTNKKDISGHVCGEKTRCLSQNMVFLRTQPGGFLFLNPTRPSAQCCQKMKWEMNLNKYKVAT